MHTAVTSVFFHGPVNGVLIATKGCTMNEAKRAIIEMVKANYEAKFENSNKYLQEFLDKEIARVWREGRDSKSVSLDNLRV